MVRSLVDEDPVELGEVELPFHAENLQSSGAPYGAVKFDYAAPSDVQGDP